MIFKVRPNIKKQFDTIHNFGIENLKFQLIRIESSVTGLLIQYLAMCKNENSPYSLQNFTKELVKHYLNKLKNCETILKFHPSGKITPNLVTLDKSYRSL